MNRCDVIAIFLIEGNKCIGILNTINKVASSLNHTLIDQLLEWLFLARNTQVEEELVPETAIDEVTSSMFATTYIQVHILPILISLFADQCLIVVGIHVAEIVSRTSCKTWHCIEFDGEDGLIVNLSIFHNLLVHFIPSPNSGIAKWRFTRFSRQELIHLWQFDRQTLFWNHGWDAVLVIYRERLTPITLTGEDGITQTVVHLYTTQSCLFHIFLCLCNSLLDGASIQRKIDIRLHILAR